MLFPRTESSRQLSADDLSAVFVLFFFFFFFRSVLTSNRHQTTWFCPSAATQLRAGLRLPIGCTTIQPVPITDPVPCQGAVEGYCIPRKSAVPPTPPNATQARAQALLSFVVYLSGQLTSFRCSSCAPCYIVSLSCLFLRQMPGMHR